MKSRPWKASSLAPARIMIKIDTIENVIARDRWRYKKNDGKIMSAEIIVGKPFRMRHEEKESWVCPVFIETFTTRVISAIGAGPVESLMSAMTLVKAFFDMYQDHFIERTALDQKIGPQAKAQVSRRKGRPPAGKRAKL